MAVAKYVFERGDYVRGREKFLEIVDLKKVLEVEEHVRRYCAE